MGTEYPAVTGPTVLRAAGDRLGAGTDALPTAVGVESSAYRRPGGKLLASTAAASEGIPIERLEGKLRRSSQSASSANYRRFDTVASRGISPTTTDRG